MLTISGFHAVESILLDENCEVLEIAYQSGRADDRLQHIIKLANNKQIDIVELPKKRLDKITNNVSHQGIIAKILISNVANDNELKDFINKQSPQLILILDNITDPRNLGACLRSANGFAVDCVIISKDGSAPINEVAYKTSSGSISALKIFQVVNLSRAIKLLQQNNIWVVGLDGSANSKINQYDFTTPTAIVMGAEGKGMRQLTKKNCDNLVKIPMFGTVESLNVAVATGIALFSAKID